MRRLPAPDCGQADLEEICQVFVRCAKLAELRRLDSELLGVL